MSDDDRMKLIVVMGANISKIDTAVKQRDSLSASAAFVQFMGAAGMLAQEIDELNSSAAN